MMKQAFNKKVHPREGDLVQVYYLFNQAPRAKRCLITKDNDVCFSYSRVQQEHLV